MNTSTHTPMHDVLDAVHTAAAETSIDFSREVTAQAERATVARIFRENTPETYEELFDLASTCESLALQPVPAVILQLAGQEQVSPYDVLNAALIAICSTSLARSASTGDVSVIDPQLADILASETLCPLWRGARLDDEELAVGIKDDFVDWLMTYYEQFGEFPREEQASEAAVEILRSWLPDKDRNPGAYIYLAEACPGLLEETFSLDGWDSLSFIDAVSMNVVAIYMSWTYAIWQNVTGSKD